MTCGASITCGKCGRAADIDLFTRTPVMGDLPRDHYQCPNCGAAFRRAHGPVTVRPGGFVLPGSVTIEEIEARL